MSNLTDTENLVSLDFNNYRELSGGDGSCMSFFNECGDYKLAVILLILLLVILYMRYRKERRRRLQKDE